ncbi:MAG: N-6 DNA methylase, partial [Planctomycetes bacterium]|nr:N-6 DNA methylase [Planctomycetota bacterium]
MNSLVECFRTLLKNADLDAAMQTTLCLLALRAAEAKGILDEDGSNQQTDLPRRLEAIPATSLMKLHKPKLLAEGFARLDKVSPDLLTPRGLGEAYQMLMECHLENSASHERINLRARRRNRGSFYTPAGIVRKMLGLCAFEKSTGRTICDPAMGSGNFLLEAVILFMEKNGGDLEGTRDFARKFIFGIDKDPVAVELAKTAFWLLLSDSRNRFTMPRENIVRADTLIDNTDALFPTVAARGGFEIMIGNPPYDVLTNFSRRPSAKEYAEKIKASGRFDKSISGQINLYRCFIERSLQLAKDGGQVCLIVPSGLLRDKTASPLRKLLINSHGADFFEFFGEGERIFESVSQAVTIFHATRGYGPPKKIRIVNQTHASSVSPEAIGKISESFSIPNATEKDWELALWLAAKATSRFSQIAEGYVGEVDQTFYRDCMSESDTGTLLLRGTHIQSFRADLSTENVKERWLEREKFLEAKGNAASLCAKRAKETRIAQLGIRNMESRPRLMAAMVPAGVYAGNSVNCWTAKDGVPQELVLALLNSSLYDWRFRLTSGNNNINICEIKTLPLPSKLDGATVKRIVESTRKLLAKADGGADCSGKKKDMDAA